MLYVLRGMTCSIRTCSKNRNSSSQCRCREMVWWQVQKTVCFFCVCSLSRRRLETLIVLYVAVVRVPGMLWHSLDGTSVSRSEATSTGCTNSIFLLARMCVFLVETVSDRRGRRACVWVRQRPPEEIGFSLIPPFELHNFSMPHLNTLSPTENWMSP